MKETAIQLFKEARCRQYIKNFFIFIPSFFAGTLLTKEYLLINIGVFILFCLLSSGIYMLNDCHDLKSDQESKNRNKRPLASGKLSVSTVFYTGCILVGLVLFLSFLYSVFLFCIFCVYCVLNVIYTLYGKSVPPLDIFIISMCFLCRIFAGTIEYSIPCSSWLIVIVTLLTLLLSVGKRMDYLPVYGYNRIFIIALLILLSGTLLICYIIYTVELKQIVPFYSTFSYLTFLPVTAGIIRYLQCILVFRKVSCPTELLFQDRGLQICTLLWGISVFVIIYCH